MLLFKIISSKSNLVEELAQFFSDRGEGELHVLLTVRPAKVGTQYHRPGNLLVMQVNHGIDNIAIPMTMTMSIARMSMSYLAPFSKQ